MSEVVINLHCDLPEPGSVRAAFARFSDEVREANERTQALASLFILDAIAWLAVPARTRLGWSRRKWTRMRKAWNRERRRWPKVAALSPTFAEYVSTCLRDGRAPMVWA